MKYTTAETVIFTRVEFDSAIAVLCAGHEQSPLLKVSQNLSLAWDILRHCQKEGGEIYQKMAALLPRDELWALASSDAAHMICNAFYEANTGCDVEIEELSDWDEE